MGKCYFSVISVFFLLVTVAGCISTDREDAPPSEARNILTVGWIGPLTGSANILGEDNLNAVKLALAEYEFRKSPSDPTINLTIVDDEYREDLTIKAYEEMVRREKPVAIFVSTYSGLLAIADRALEDSVLIINPIDNDRKLTDLNHNVFMLAKETESLAGIDAIAIIDQGKKNTAVIYYGSDDFMPTVAKTLVAILLSNDNKVKLFEYKAGTKDFKPFFEWGKEHNVDSYAFFGYKEIGLALRQARDMGIKEPFYTVNVAISDDEQFEELLEGIYFSHFTSLDGNRVIADEFLYNYGKHYNKKPFLEWTALQAYDAATILFSSIKIANQIEGNFTDNLRDTLLGIANFEGVSGMITFLPSGSSRGIYPNLYIFKNGKAVRASKINP